MQNLKPLEIAEHHAIGDFVQGYFLVRIKCRCGHEREARGEFIRRVIGIHTRLGELQSRLRCHMCGERAARVQIFRLPR